MNLSELTDKMMAASRLIDKGVDALREYGVERAEAEFAYRKGRAEAYARAPDGTVDTTKAWVDGTTADLRRARDLAEVTRDAARQALLSRRTQLSSLQSLLNAHRAEVESFAYGPQDTP